MATSRPNARLYTGWEEAICKPFPRPSTTCQFLKFQNRKMRAKHQTTMNSAKAVCKMVLIKSSLSSLTWPPSIMTKHWMKLPMTSLINTLNWPITSLISVSIKVCSRTWMNPLNTKALNQKITTPTISRISQWKRQGRSLPKNKKTLHWKWRFKRS